MTGVLDHVTIVAVDFPRSVEFYDTVLGALGLDRVVELVDEEEDDPDVEAVAWGGGDGVGVLWLVAAGTPTTGLHVRLRAPDRAAVEAFHEGGLRLGATSRAAPRRWAIYRRGEFGAMLTDPAGNLVEAVAAE